MPQLRTAGLLLIGCLGCAAEPSEERTAWPDQEIQVSTDGDLDVAECEGRNALISNDSIAGIGLDGLAADLMRACPHELGWDWGDEGILQPAIVVHAGGTNLVALVSDTSEASRIIAVQVSGESAKTADGLGAGSTLSDVVARYGAPRLVEGECVIEAQFSGMPQLFWRLDTELADCPEIHRIARDGDIEAIPASSRISRVTLAGS